MNDGKKNRELTLASRNPHKADELRAMLGGKWRVRSLLEFPALPEIIEDGGDFRANAEKKAVEISRHVAGLVLADDSGLEVDALNGAPGVYSARYAGRQGDDAANNQKLLTALAETPDDRRGAQFHCVLVAAEKGGVKFAADGICRGRIIREMRGAKGFGYDPLFVPELEPDAEAAGLTFAEIPADTKNRVSHRARAMVQMLRWLETE